MSFHQSSPTMRLSNGKCQFVSTITLLSIVWTMLFTGAVARPSLDALLANKQNDVSQLFLDELLASATNGDKFLHELKKYHQKQPSYLAKWPGLRDLVLTIDYDDDTATTMENNDFLERLRQLGGSPPYDMYDDVREDAGDDGTMISNTPAKAGKTPANQLIFKEHNSKKNVQFHKQYMSPCHFKICNMGRKRNARLVANNY